MLVSDCKTRPKKGGDTGSAFHWLACEVRRLGRRLQLVEAGGRGHGRPGGHSKSSKSIPQVTASDMVVNAPVEQAHVPRSVPVTWARR